MKTSSYPQDRILETNNIKLIQNERSRICSVFIIVYIYILLWLLRNGDRMITALL